MARPPPNFAVQGLTTAEAERRLASAGPNELTRRERRSALRLLFAQFESPVVWLLLAASCVSALLGELLNALAIAVVLALNAVVGFVQEHRAANAIDALRAMTARRARVVRDGHASLIGACDIVRGDVLLLEPGDIVAADARLLECHHVSVNEACLTGESMPVDKQVGADDAHVAHVFMGTAFATGSALAEVTATGMGTELGRVAHLLTAIEDPETPLQTRLARVSRVLIGVCLAIVALVGVLGVARGIAPVDVLVSAVSLAVAAVPEGLPALVTVALALGVQRMAARHVLVRRMSAVETLGCATVVCTDKTGTLTTGVMTVVDLWSPDPTSLLEAGASCCDAELGAAGVAGVGDATELAILSAAAERGIRREQIERDNPRRAVHPFDAARKRMSIARADGVLYVKGAVDVIVPRCARTVPGVEIAHARMASRGLRVLAIATGSGATEEGLTLLGLVGIADPPRPEARDAVARARAAGVRVVMITGDHHATARAIASDLGIVRDGEDPAEVVFARATPETKLEIVRRWKDAGEIVAMTGDGVNDAPAVREAHIGIAMGKSGTEVTREAADMIIANDDFASIVAAIEEGRGIFDNIRKAMVYLLATNAAELGLMFAAAVVGLPVPLLPLQLLWVNLMTDGLPALALVLDAPADDVLSRPPRDPAERMLGRRQWTTILALGAVQATTSFGVFSWALGGHDLVWARSMALSTLVFGQLFLAFVARSESRVFWRVGALSNVRLVLVVALSCAAQLLLPWIPGAASLLGVQALAATDLAVAVGLGLLPATLVELAKLGRNVLSTVSATHSHRAAPTTP